MPETEIIDKVLQGDKQAFGKLINKYQSSVVNTCFGFVHNRADAEDIAQDVFVEIWHSLSKFRKESKFSTWVYRISVNKSLNFIRKNKKHSSNISINNFGNNDKQLDIEADKNTLASFGVEEKERAEILYKAINSLSKNQRIAFTLNKYEDLSYKKIADVMDISLSSVESLIHRAKINLQKKLIKYYKKI